MPGTIRSAIRGTPPGDPLRRRVRPRLLLRRGRRRRVHAPRGSGCARSPTLAGEAFNFSNAAQVTVLELVALILERGRTHRPRAGDPERRAERDPGAVPRSVARRERVLGWTPEFDAGRRACRARPSGTGTSSSSMSAEPDVERSSDAAGHDPPARRRVPRAAFPPPAFVPGVVAGAGLRPGLRRDRAAAPGRFRPRLLADRRAATPSAFERDFARFFGLRHAHARQLRLVGEPRWR